MEGILSIHSIVHKKEKNKALAKKSLSIIQSSSKNLREINSHSINNSLIEEKLFGNIRKNSDVKSKKNLSQKKEIISLYKKYNFEEKSRPLISSDDTNTLKSEFKNEKESNTPLMNLQRIKKPNYMRKSAFIKDKSLTPQEKIIHNSSCPIYDFYSGSTGVSTNKNENIVPNRTFTKYYNNFKQVNKTPSTVLFDPSPSPLTNLSSKNSMNYYLNLGQNDLFERNKNMNEKFYDKLSPLDELENNNTIYNLENDENYYELKNEMYNFEGNTPSYVGGMFSPSYDFFEENICGNNENNYLKSPINYRQMNVNININNNSQNNNIYYQFPNIINNNSSNNSFIKNSNNKELNNLNPQDNNYNENLVQKNWQINNINNLKDLQNHLNNNQINISYPNFYREFNNRNFSQKRPINLNSQNDAKMYFSPHNQKNNLNQFNNNTFFKLKNQFEELNTNTSNYLNPYSDINNINKINNFNQNDTNNNRIDNQNINFSLVANAYINQNALNQNFYNNNSNLFQSQYQTSMNDVNNNSINGQPLQQYINNQHTNINSMTESFLYSLSPIQLANQCHIIAKNQNGCKYLQNYISMNSELLKSLFFPKILEHLKELSNDQFGNYFIKKIFSYLTEEMILLFIKTLFPIIEEIGTNQYGSRVLQDLIDFLDSEKTFLALLNIIIPHVKLLIIDLNGSHIIYKLIITKNKSAKIIEDIICMQVKDIALTRKGCSFLRRYFDFKEESDLIKIKQNILQNLTEIITDQYGNYVIQSILLKEGSPIAKEFIKEINKNIVFYSINKFSSNAVEKCFENEEMRSFVIDQLLQKDIFEKLLFDKFGNYVVQKAIAKADNNSRNYIFQLLLPLIPNLKTQYFGQRLLTKLVSQYPNLSDML